MTAAVAQLGPLGVFLLMVPESACLPLPSEVTLMSAGFGVDQGWFSFPVAVAAAIAGNLTGSLIAYGLGRAGALSRVQRRGGKAMERCEQLFARRGDTAVFLARLLPLARTFVSLPAGHFRVPLLRFIALTVAGCAIWSVVFVMWGMLAGATWRATSATVEQIAILLAGLGLAVFLLGPRVQSLRRRRAARR